MADNVRCTGRRYPDPTRPDRYQLTLCATGPGFAWSGERYAMGRLDPKVIERIRYGTPAWFDAVAVADAKARTRKPCPRCGGQVEVIGDEADEVIPVGRLVDTDDEDLDPQEAT